VGVWRRVARARLASQVLRRLRRAGVRNARYDWRTFSVQFTPSGHEVPLVLELSGLLADRSGRRRDRRARRNQFVDGFLRSPGVPEAWDQACPRLRPVLRGVSTVAPGVDASLRRPVLPFLAEFVVVDQPDTMTYVSADQLSGWGVSAGEVFAAAQANLAGAELRGAAQGPTVVRFVDDGDSYWTSHLLLDGWLGRLSGQVGGVPVAFAPERGTLLVTAADGEHLTALFAQAEAIYLSAARPISPMAYTSGARGRTVPYQAPAGHPLHRRVERAEALLAATEYTRQAEAFAQARALPPASGRAAAEDLEQADPSERSHEATDAATAAPPRRQRPPVKSLPAELTPAEPALGEHAAAERSAAEQSAAEQSAAEQAPVELTPDDLALVELAPMEVVGSDDAGWRTRTTWSSDGIALLPRADEITHGDRVLAWSHVDASAVAGFDPPRYRVTVRS
jgi:hypothetical protein